MPPASEIERRVTEAVGALDGVRAVDLDFTVMTDDERGPSASSSTAIRRPPPARTRPTGTPRAGRSRSPIPPSRTRVLLIASGKGGVGKSSVTTNLAVALAARGHSVAVVDADVWGFSIPRMLGVDRPPVVIDEMLLPPEAYGVRCISMGFFAEEDQPVIWRGPMLHKALEQFLTDVYWDEPDFLVVDLPPGTGDVAHLAGAVPARAPRCTSSPRRSRPRRRSRSGPRSWPRR